MNTVPIDASNADQERAWDGDEGAYWAARADDFDRATAEHHARFMSAARIERGERVLDIGCGTGESTLDAARAATDGLALGVDLSSAMLDVARRRAATAGITNVRFERADAQVHQFAEGEFDVAIGRTSAMFFGDRVAGLANVGRALCTGGRLVLLTWQSPADNEWIREISGALAAGRDMGAPPADAPGPFTLSDPDVITNVLTAAGYTEIEIEPSTAPMWFGEDADATVDFVLGLMGWMLEGLDDNARNAAVGALRSTAAAHETPDGVRFGSAAWLIRARRP